MVEMRRARRRREEKEEEKKGELGDTSIFGMRA